MWPLGPIYIVWIQMPLGADLRGWALLPNLNMTDTLLSMPLKAIDAANANQGDVEAADATQSD